MITEDSLVENDWGHNQDLSQEPCELKSKTVHYFRV